MRRRARLALRVALVGIAAIGALLGVAGSGLYSVSALDQHLLPVYRFLEWTMERSVERAARRVGVARSFEPEAARRGLAHYRAHCVTCHGAPGVAPGAAAMGMTPAPSNLVQSARNRTTAELYWVIENGIKMSGMPAWKYRLTETELRELVAFVSTLPDLSPAAYRAMRPLERRAAPASSGTDSSDGDPVRGREALQQYACHTCHAIPGIVGASVDVGPPLDGVAARTYLGGVLFNTRENMVRWILAPQTFAPDSAMPDMGVTPADARDMVAYLYAETGARGSPEDHRHEHGKGHPDPEDRGGHGDAAGPHDAATRAELTGD